MSQKYMPHMDEQRALILALSEELKVYTNLFKGLEQNLYYRAHIRIIFSLFESVLYTARDDLLAILASSDIKYEKALADIPGALKLLGLKSRDGKWVEVKPTMDDHIHGIRKLAGFLSDNGILQNDLIVDAFSSKPENFALVKDKRDEISHPKSLKSLEVSGPVITGINGLMQWTMKITNAVASITLADKVTLLFGHLLFTIANDTGWIEAPMKRVPKSPAGTSPRLPPFSAGKNS